MAELQWPAGVEPRQRRPVDASLGGALVTGALGGAIWGPAGAFLGGLGGLILGSAKKTLENAVRDELAERGKLVVSYERTTRLYVKIVFRLQDGRFYSVESRAPSLLSGTPEQLDDWLFGDLIARCAHIS